jgi:hypothetical protein
MKPTLTLRQQQSKFASMVPRLIDKAIELGFEVTLGDAYRDPRCHGDLGVKMGYGSRNSYHKIRLAIDINLFKNGQFMSATEDHLQLGEWWETQGGTWGGRFKEKDGNHYSYGEGR